MDNRTEILDLRTALQVLRGEEGQLIETDVPVDTMAELSGVYRYVGAGGTVKRPTGVNGPAMVFHNLKGFPEASAVIGILGSRKRTGLLLGCPPESLGQLLCECAQNPIPPVVSREKASCQEVVHYAYEEGFDLRRLLPAPTNTPVDAGPYITMGMCYASHPDTGVSDVTIHRMCLQGKEELSIFFTPGARHIGAMAERAEELGQSLPISISIGVDPAISLTSCFEPPTTPLGFNELSIAGALRRQPVRLCPCLTIQENAIANAEYVIEGEILPGKRIREDQGSNTGYAMPGRLRNVYAHPSGGGKYMVILQIAKKQPSDEGRQRQAALLAFSAFSELKHVILVDEDVDIFDTDDVLWALNTRYQGDVDTIFIPGVRCHPLDPSQRPDYSPSIPDVGISCKTIFDCTVPFRMKERFRRAEFMEVDPEKWIKKG